MNDLTLWDAFYYGVAAGAGWWIADKLLKLLGMIFVAFFVTRRKQDDYVTRHADRDS